MGVINSSSNYSKLREAAYVREVTRPQRDFTFFSGRNIVTKRHLQKSEASSMYVAKFMDYDGYKAFKWDSHWNREYLIWELVTYGDARSKCTIPKLSDPRGSCKHSSAAHDVSA